MKQTTTALPTSFDTAEEAPLSALPCSDPCPKCGSTDINRQYRKPGVPWDTPYGHPDRVNDFVEEDRWSGFAKKECVSHSCRCCQYQWEGDVLPQDVKHTKTTPKPSTKIRLDQRLVRWCRDYGYAAWLGASLAAVGYDFMTWQFWVVMLPAVSLIGWKIQALNAKYRPALKS